MAIKDILDIHTEVGKQDFLDIRVTKAVPPLSEIDVLGPDRLTLYSLRPIAPLDKTSLVVVLAQQMSRDLDFGFGRDQLPYRWAGNKWVSVERWLASLDYSMHALIRTAVNRRMSSDSLAFEALAAWQANSTYPQDGLDLRAFGDCPGIPFRDMVLKLSKGAWTTVPHSPKNFNTHVLNLDADEAGRMYMEVSLGDHDDSMLMKFLRTTLDDQQQIVFRRWLGYHLLSSRLPNAEKMLYLWGSGANGKSQLLWLIRSLVGAEACAELRLPDLRTSANIEKLVSKLAMVGSEAKTNTDLETLKSLISREPLNCNPKYRDPFTVTPECLVSQASNQAPEFGEKSDAMVRRTLSLHLKNSFLDESARKEDIAQSIIEKEYALLVGLALWGAEELSEKGRFFIPEGVAELSRKTVSGGNQISEFAKIVEFGPYEISHPELYVVYVRWCRDEGDRSVMTRKVFMSEVERLATIRKRTVMNMPKATNYEPQNWRDENGNVAPVHRSLKTDSRPNILCGLRIAANAFGLPIGQNVPASRRLGHLFAGPTEPDPVSKVVLADAPVADIDGPAVEMARPVKTFAAGE